MSLREATSRVFGTLGPTQRALVADEVPVLAGAIDSRPPFDLSPVQLSVLLQIARERILQGLSKRGFVFRSWPEFVARLDHECAPRRPPVRFGRSAHGPAFDVAEAAIEAMELGLRADLEGAERRCARELPEDPVATRASAWWSALLDRFRSERTALVEQLGVAVACATDVPHSAACVHAVFHRVMGWPEFRVHQLHGWATAPLSRLAAKRHKGPGKEGIFGAGQLARTGWSLAVHDHLQQQPLSTFTACIQRGWSPWFVQASDSASASDVELADSGGTRPFDPRRISATLRRRSLARILSELGRSILFTEFAGEWASPLPVLPLRMALAESRVALALLADAGDARLRSVRESLAIDPKEHLRRVELAAVVLDAALERTDAGDPLRATVLVNSGWIGAHRMDAARTEAVVRALCDEERAAERERRPELRLRARMIAALALASRLDRVDPTLREFAQLTEDCRAEWATVPSHLAFTAHVWFWDFCARTERWDEARSCWTRMREHYPELCESELPYVRAFLLHGRNPDFEEDLPASELRVLHALHERGTAEVGPPRYKTLATLYVEQERTAEPFRVPF